MRVLVTGGAGFIGSHVVEELVVAGHDVVVLDSLHPAAHHAEPEVHPQVEYVRGDLCERVVVARALRGVDAVTHQGAMVGLGVDFADVVDYVTANDLGTATLLRVMHDAGSAARLVLASSMVVYGEGGYTCGSHGEVSAPPRPESRLARGDWEPLCPHCGASLVPHAVDEARRADPRNVYAATKLQQEHLCAAFGREHGVPVVALRYHNVYGPRMPRDTPYAGVASIFRSALEAGRPPEVFEDGGQLRDFVHVRDVARANRRVLESDDPWSGAVNVASGRPRAVLDLASALSSSFGPGAPAPIVVPRYRVGDVRHVFASTDVARERFGFETEVAFEDGVTEFATAPMR